MRKFLLATKNPGKILEYKEILKGSPFEFLTLKELGITEWPEEDQETFKENALKKARFYSAFTDLPVLAEDSGLEIDYLGGKPGVLSRRWPGHEASDKELIRMTLEKLKGVPQEKRSAHFKVVMAFKFPRQNIILTSEGVLNGYILEKAIGKIIPGYPFRSLFYIPEIGKALGELSMEEEAKIAHRKKALEKLISLIKNP
jgi:XTP/dITP diphosphohydrolase